MSDNLRLERNGADVEGKRSLAIRDSFVRHTGPLLIRERQHHAFKMYLLALWVHYPVGEPRLSSLLENKHLAALLDLGKEHRSRASAASHVLAVLGQKRLIRREFGKRQRTIIVCREDGKGKKYSRPRGGGANSYIEVPGEFFSNGWLNRLSAPAILMLLIALREERFMDYRRTKEKGWAKSFDWFQPVAYLTKSYPVGKTTMEKGLHELRQCGFLTAELTRHYPRKGKTLRNRRNLYTNHPGIFGEPA